MAKKPRSISVTKLDSARRQIETAISLWFDDGDPVAVHTLTAAAHRVCHDLIEKNNKINKTHDTTLFSMVLIHKGKEVEYESWIRKAENFFKHSDRKADKPTRVLKFFPEATQFYLIDAIEAHHKLAGRSTPLMMAFRFRLILFHPDLLTSGPLPFAKEALCIEWRRLTKNEFLQAFNLVLNHFSKQPFA